MVIRRRIDCTKRFADGVHFRESPVRLVSKISSDRKQLAFFGLIHFGVYKSPFICLLVFRQYKFTLLACFSCPQDTGGDLGL